MNKPENQHNFFRKRVIILIVCIITGFILGYSYNLTKDDKVKIKSPFFEQEEYYREELINQKEQNKKLAEELDSLQKTVNKHENEVARNEEEYSQLANEAEKLREILGKQKVKGKGIKITLKDGDYNQNNTNPNDYIVHEGHILKVINELKISGAKAISINGRRLKTNSYIQCNGPVITIDGEQFPAPFIIEAIGNPKTLLGALKINGGIVDQFVNDDIIITLEEKETIQMPSINDKVKVEQQ